MPWKNLPREGVPKGARENGIVRRLGAQALLVGLVLSLTLMACIACSRPDGTLEPADAPAPTIGPPTAVPSVTPGKTSTPRPDPTAEPTRTLGPIPSPTLEPTSLPTGTPETLSVPTPGSTTTLEIINESGTDIWSLYLSPADRDQWSDDEYLGDTIIAAGETLTLTGIPNGSYNVLVEGNLYNDIETWYDVAFDGIVTWRVIGSEAETAPLTINNSSPVDMGYVYVRPTQGSEWGDNLLGANVIGPGESLTLIGIERGTYDVRAEGMDHGVVGTWYDAEFYDAYGPKTWTVVGADDTASLTIVNSCSVPIGYVYLAPSYSDDWGDNLLRDGPIDPGESAALTDIPFGTYDMRAETSDHGGIDAQFEQTLDGPRTWEVAHRSGEFLPRVDQWALAATASSERSGSDWSAEQATGEPDTPGCGDHATAWASAAPDSVDWLEVAFPLSVVPRRINVHETLSPGFIVRVEVVDEADQYHTVWEGGPVPVDECPHVFSVLTTEIDANVDKVRIHLDQRGAASWNQIDAVELVGLDVVW